MDDLISRKALIAEYDRVHIGEPGKARKLIEEAPSVEAVEVVRCKDCKQYEYIVYDYGRCRKTMLLIKNDDFCSCGERKDGE